MSVLHWCMLGVTLLLLMCEVAISQLCKSLITLVDGFHTLFMVMHMALPLPETEVKPSIASFVSSAFPPRGSSSLAALPPSPPADASIKPLPASHTVTRDSATSDQLPSAQPNHDSASPVNSHQRISPAALNCGLSYTNSRIQAVGVFISTLLLASLCTSYMIEIISFSLAPHPVQRPLLLVVVGGVSLLHKMLLFWLNWDQLQEDRAGGSREPESYLQVNHTVSAEQESIDRGESKEIHQTKVRSAEEEDSLQRGGVLVLHNPGTSSVPGSESEAPQQQMDVHLNDCEVQSSVEELMCENHSEDTTGSHKYNTCMGLLDGQKPSHHVERPCGRWAICLFSFIFVIQGLFTSFLALINSVVMLLVNPHFPHSTETCSLLVYLDPALSVLGVITLLAATLPQVYRYGLLLLQATPPQVCVSDLGRRIASVPGVQAVHDLHIWQLTESLMVASVHVHCYAGFPAHRCADLMSGVTKVLQSVGVSCCTVQPEFTSCSGSGPSTDSGADACPVVHREDPSLPPLLACSLACGKACAGNMCCSLLEEMTQSPLTPPAGETKEEPQTLVIENTFV